MPIQQEHGLIPAGHHYPDDAPPLVKLLMRNLAAASFGSGDRRLGDAIKDEQGGIDRRGDLYSLACYVIESLPSEIVILRGGCGGEPTSACYTMEGYDDAHKKFAEFWGDSMDDPLWAIVERIPVVKR